MSTAIRHTCRLALASVAAAVLALLAACTADENRPISGLGFARFEVSVETNELAPSALPFALTVATADGSESHTWASITDVPPLESYHVGSYTATAVSGDLDAEGYDCPCYAGAVDFDIAEAQYHTVKIVCTLQQALVKVHLQPGLLGAYPDAMVQVHSVGHSYVGIDPNRTDAVMLAPGATKVFVTLSHEGKTVTVAPDFSLQTAAGRQYEININLEADDVLAVSSGQNVSRMALGPEIFDAPAPEIEASGFDPAVPLALMEGYPASQPVVMTVTAPAGLQAAMLSIVGSVPALEHIAVEADILQPSPALAEHGLEVEMLTDGRLRVDFTKLLESLSVNSNSECQFMLQALDRLGRASDVMRLTVKIVSVQFGVISQTPAMVGENVASMTLALNVDRVEASDFAVHVTDAEGNILRPAPIESAILDEYARTITLAFNIGEGKDPVPVQIDYMGNTRVMAMAQRAVAPYQVSIDPFALSAVITVKADTESATRAIATMATVWANGRELAVDARSPEKGTIRVVGLQPGTAYDVQLRVVEGSYVASKSTRTEEAVQLPEPDFEEFSDLITYKRMPQGGIYSTTVFPVYNMQNYCDITVSWVRKYWTSVNAKTFCSAAKRHNSWYMQPSSMIDFSLCVSGSKSMLMQSVGWDLDGPEIEPYAQAPGQYLPYNANVPAISHRSAGRLFLGEYAFDPATCTETYTEGIPFRSRPSAINGFYRYIPDEQDYTDRGILRVELLNETDGPKPVVLAVAEMEFGSSPDFVAFNLPINYDIIGLKATKIKVMFCSSSRYGDIAHEDANVPVTPRLEPSTSLGSQLWIDNLSLSYSY